MTLQRLKSLKNGSNIVLIQHASLTQRGGEELYTLYVAKSLKQLGFTPILVVEEYNPETTYSELKNYQIIVLSKNIIKFLANIITVWYKLKPKIVFMLAPTLRLRFTLLLLLATFTRSRIIIRLGYTALPFLTSRCAELPHLARYKGKPIRSLIRFINIPLIFKSYFIMNNEETIKGFINCIKKSKICYYIALRRRIIALLPPPVEIPEEQPRIEKKMNNRSIIVVSRISPEKNIHKAIMAFAILSKKINNIKLIIIGDIIDKNIFHY